MQGPGQGPHGLVGALAGLDPGTGQGQGAGRVGAGNRVGPQSWDGVAECGGCWGMAVKGSAGPSASPGTRGWLEQVSGALRPCGVAVGDGAVPKHHLGAKVTRDGVGASTPASALCQPRVQRCPHPSNSCPPERGQQEPTAPGSTQVLPACECCCQLNWKNKPRKSVEKGIQ